jgi:hypothetical protein
MGVVDNTVRLDPINRSANVVAHVAARMSCEGTEVSRGGGLRDNDLSILQ